MSDFTRTGTFLTLWQYVQPAIERGDFQLGGGGLKALEMSEVEQNV